MTLTPRRARGVIDAETGALLAVTSRWLSWLPAGGSRVDVTPDFDWGPVAAGGGAVAVAGSEYLQWHGPGGAARTIPAPSEVSYRLAVAGSAVAAVSGHGRLTCWRSLDAAPQSATVDVEPDGLAIDRAGARVVVWGWDGGGNALMTVFAWTASALTVVEPVVPWPAPDCGVALLADGVIGVGGSGSILLRSATGENIGDADLPGLERLTGSVSGLAWIRSLGDDAVVAGVGQSTSRGGLEVVAEAPIPSTDPFPEFAAVAAGKLLLAAGVGPDELEVQRLTAAGWTEPETIVLTSRA